MSTVKINLQESKLPAGWKKIRDVVINNGDELKLDIFLKEDDRGYVGGAEMIKRAKKMGGLTGRAHADYLLAHQDEIPVEWRNFFLVFAGCECEDSDGCPRVPCLYFDGDRWHLRFSWLGSYFFGDYRLVRLYK